MSVVYLLDVNVLLALADPMHANHESAHQWFAERGASAWATCPITENGFVRIASHPQYPNSLGNPTTALSLLATFCAHPGHRFLPDAVTLRESLVPNVVLTHNHVTDVYLLAMVADHGGKLATLDRRIPAMAIQGGADLLEIIA